MRLLEIIRGKKLVVFALACFVVISVWWVTIFLRGLVDTNESYAFALIYPLTSLFGGIVGLILAKQWGGRKSIIGKTMLAFSWGLLGQAFGQACYQYYFFILKVEIPYPSIGDLGFFSTGIFYAYGAIQLMRATGARFSMRNYGGKIVAVAIPILWAIASYYFFLRGYQFDLSHPVTVILDLISPIIDSIYLSLAILVYLLSSKFLGGLMKWPLILLLVAVIAEVVTDFTFMFLATHHENLIYAAAFNDYMYFVAYTLMTIALIRIGSVFNKITAQQ